MIRTTPNRPAMSRRSNRGVDVPLIEFSAVAPYWTYVYPHYSDYWRDDTFLYGEELPTPIPWLVWYQGIIDPDVDTPTWVETLLGVVPHGCSDGIFLITDTTGVAGYLYYHIVLTDLDSNDGTILEARLLIDEDVAAVNQGAVISVFDGTYQFAAWLRRDGLNLDGQANIPADLSDFVRVRLETQGIHSHLYLNGELQQYAPFMNPTTEQKIVFGTYVQW